MPIVFAGIPGRVAKLDDPGVNQGLLPGAVTVKQAPISYDDRLSIITRVSLAQETSQQFLHTLGGDVYIYVFGDRIGQMTISGLCLALDCEQSELDAGNEAGGWDHGVEKMLDWWKENKLSKRPKPLITMIGNKAIPAFAGQMVVSVFDHKLNLWQFDLNLFVVPER